VGSRAIYVGGGSHKPTYDQLESRLFQDSSCTFVPVGSTTNLRLRDSLSTAVMARLKRFVLIETSFEATGSMIYACNKSVSRTQSPHSYSNQSSTRELLCQHF
jgi:hypothetical protein